MKEAIILAGGESLRMKPYFKWCKTLLKFGQETLLDYQIRWLIENGFEHIIVATTEETLNKWHKVTTSYSVYDYLDFSLEWKKLGTSGAVLRAGDYLNSDRVYIMNVDDILLDFNPNILYCELERGGIITLHKPKIGFGLVRMRNGLITRFQEKPYIKYWVSCGHYLFMKNIIRDYFVEQGDLEKEVLPKLAKEKKLQGYKYTGRWITINTWKDYIEALKNLNLLSRTEIYSPAFGGYIYEENKQLY